MAGLGYPGGRTGFSASYDNDGFRGTRYASRGVGYAGGRTGNMAMTDNDALRGLGNSNNLSPNLLMGGMGMGGMLLLAGLGMLLVLRK
jgi:hypothetical protein